MEEGHKKDWKWFSKADQKKKKTTNRMDFYLKDFLLLKLEDIQGQKGSVKKDDNANDWLFCICLY